MTGELRPFVLSLPPGGTLSFEPGFLSVVEADAALAQLMREVPFVQEDVIIFGRRVPQPRLSLWMGDADAFYTYSGVRREPAPWHPLVRELRERAETASGVRFNSVLLNLYRDGLDSMGMHADGEPELGPEPVIASLSLGATRRFVLRPKKKGNRLAGTALPLTHGSLVVMRGTMQRHWAHGVPKDRQVAAPRINLTFRCVHH